ncbi:hypothetical protein J4E91_004825 [Alternaria rosae]|nr:hypothetical protein J4E91_004825 [Alternaria rosae]
MAPKNRLTAKAKAISNTIQKLRDNQEARDATAKEIEELEARQNALETEQGKLQRKKKNLDATYEKSIDEYSPVWNREFATNFLEVLTTRELRDEVFIYLIGGFPNATILPNSRNLPEYTMNDYFLHRQPIDRRERSQPRGRDDALAHYFLERFMGEEFAVEIAQIFHRYAIYKVCNVYDVFTLLEDGPLTVHPSCQPQHYIRTPKVAVFMDELFSDSDGEFAWQSAPEENAKEVVYENQLAWLEDLEELDQISQLNVRLKLESLVTGAFKNEN